MVAGLIRVNKAVETNQTLGFDSIEWCSMCPREGDGEREGRVCRVHEDGGWW